MLLAAAVPTPQLFCLLPSRPLLFMDSHFIQDNLQLGQNSARGAAASEQVKSMCCCPAAVGPCPWKQPGRDEGGGLASTLCSGKASVAAREGGLVVLLVVLRAEQAAALGKDGWRAGAAHGNATAALGWKSLQGPELCEEGNK